VAVPAATMQKPKLIRVTADEAARLNPGKCWEPPIWQMLGHWYGESTAIERWREQVRP
jgi:hypothetical protein